MVYASDSESERDAAVERELDYYVSAAVASSAGLETPVSRRSVRAGRPMRPDLTRRRSAQETSWLEPEHGNVVAAVRLAERVSLHQYAWQLARASWAYFFNRGHVDDLLDTHRNGLSAAERLEDTHAVGTMLNYLASGHYRIGDCNTAVDLMERAVTLRLTARDEVGAATARMNLATILHRLGRLTEATRLHKQVLAVWQYSGDLDCIGTSLSNMGTVCTTSGRYREALVYHRRHLAIARQMGDVYGLARALGHLGAIRIRMGEHEIAVRLLTASLRLKREVGARAGEAEVLNDIGSAKRALGLYDEAVGWHHEAVATAREIGDRPGLCRARNDLGRTLRKSGEVPGALEQHRVVLAEASKIKLKYEQGRALDGIAACLRDTEPDEARRHWQRALVLYGEMGVPERAEVEHALAELAQRVAETRHSRQALSAITTTPETR